MDGNKWYIFNKVWTQLRTKITQTDSISDNQQEVHQMPYMTTEIIHIKNLFTFKQITLRIHAIHEAKFQ